MLIRDAENKVNIGLIHCPYCEKIIPVPTDIDKYEKWTITTVNASKAEHDWYCPECGKMYHVFATREITDILPCKSRLDDKAVK